MKKLLFLLFLPPLIFANFFQDRVKHVAPGDYIVTEQDKNISLIRIHSFNKERLFLEEISFPSPLTPSIRNEWQQWIFAGAKGHTSWVLYEIAIKEATVIRAYSYTRSSWVEMRDQSHFISSLFHLSFTEEPAKMRKRVGPPPPPTEEIDRRTIWSPPAVVEGKALPCPKFSVYYVDWPKDGSELAGKTVEFYFADNYPFPFWIQVLGTGNTVVSKVIDSGRNLSSLYPDLPSK